ncbi:MAG: glutathione S-transferase family protein [Pseudobdellovibrionaceae bacterium]
MAKSEKIQLVIGDKNLSSWSMRPWLVLKQSGLAFEEIKILLDRPETKKRIRAHSPSGKVPCLVHGDLKIWESLAIAEYVAELAPGKKLWPESPEERALARSYAAEMHAGFSCLRSQLSMDLQLRTKAHHLNPGTISDIERILELWTQALEASKGPFLFGTFGIVDAFFAPVVCRFVSYGIEIQNKKALGYVDNILKHSSMKVWLAEAKKEKPLVIPFI